MLRLKELRELRGLNQEGLAQNLTFLNLQLVRMKQAKECRI